jgi:hypothetical protein
MTKDRPHTTVVAARITIDERRRLEAVARLAGSSPSQIIRAAIQVATRERLAAYATREALAMAS